MLANWLVFKCIFLGIAISDTYIIFGLNYFNLRKFESTTILCFHHDWGSSNRKTALNFLPLIGLYNIWRGSPAQTLPTTTNYIDLDVFKVSSISLPTLSTLDLNGWYPMVATVKLSWPPLTLASFRLKVSLIIPIQRSGETPLSTRLYAWTFRTE